MTFKQREFRCTRTNCTYYSSDVIWAKVKVNVMSYVSHVSHWVCYGRSNMTYLISRDSILTNQRITS